MKILEWQKLNLQQRQQILSRPVAGIQQELQTKVQAIIQHVQENGDRALIEFTQKFDQVELTKLLVSEKEFTQATAQISPAAIAAIKQAYANIHQFHKAQLPHDISLVMAPGIVCEKVTRPIARVGLYVPGGSAPLPSTVLMLGIPAQIAGCPLRVLCTPPRKDGSIDPHILYAANMCGIKQIYKVGGAQAIAAMGFGTESVPKVNKIFGPGNAWVTQAKILVGQDPQGAAYDMPAGPSEVMVIADDSANPAFVAADLLSQAEHGPDSQVILLCFDNNFAQVTQQEVLKQLDQLPRHEIAARALQNSSALILDNMEQALTITNEYAPEHLILSVKNARQYLASVQTAGSVFLGNYSPEAAGDYASGTNHVLPTYGYGHAYSGLGVNDFMRFMTCQELSPTGLASIATSVECLANVEGLTAHARAVTIRVKVGAST